MKIIVNIQTKAQPRDSSSIIKNDFHGHGHRSLIRLLNRLTFSHQFLKLQHVIFQSVIVVRPKGAKRQEEQTV